MASVVGFTQYFGWDQIFEVHQQKKMKKRDGTLDSWLLLQPKAKVVKVSCGGPGCGQDILPGVVAELCKVCDVVPFCMLCTIRDVETCSTCSAKGQLQLPLHPIRERCVVLNCKKEVWSSCCGVLFCHDHRYYHDSAKHNPDGLTIFCPVVPITKCVGSFDCNCAVGYATRFGELCPLHITRQHCAGCKSYFPQRRVFKVKYRRARICCPRCAEELIWFTYCVEQTQRFRVLISIFIHFYCN